MSVLPRRHSGARLAGGDDRRFWYSQLSYEAVDRTKAVTGTCFIEAAHETSHAGGSARRRLPSSLLDAVAQAVEDLLLQSTTDFRIRGEIRATRGNAGGGLRETEKRLQDGGRRKPQIEAGFSK